VEADVGNTTAESGSLLLRFVPGLAELRNYPAGSLRGDLVAGGTLAAYLIPAAIGDASLARLPPESGLYACLFSGLVYWLFCSSRQTVITITSAISLLIGTSLGALAGGDPARYASLASITALIVASLALVAWGLRAGAAVNFISETVLVGFKAGVALYLGSTQLPKLFGLDDPHGEFWERLTHFLSHLDEAQPTSVVLGLGALALLLAGKRWLPNKPIALIVVIAGIAAVPIFGLEARGVALLGAVPQGLPRPGFPAIRADDLNDLLPLAMACFLLAAVETTAIGRTFARKYRYRLDSNQEFLALAVANGAAGLGQGFPVSGGMSQSLVNEEGGAQSPLSGLFAAGFVLLVTLFVAGLLHDLPQPVLAAIVLVAVTGLFQWSELKRLWYFSQSEFAVAIASLFGVLGSGLLRGVLIGAVMSILLMLRRGSRPHTTELGRVPGTDYFADVIRHPENEREPSIFAFRVESALLYFNVEHVRDRFFELLKQRDDAIELAVLFLGTVPAVDLAAVEMLEELHHTLRDRGIELRLAEAHGNVRETLRRAGYEEECAPVSANESVATIVAAWRAQRGASSPE
jgi:high affinity sulfate transporter 1